MTRSRKMNLNFPPLIPNRFLPRTFSFAGSKNTRSGGRRNSGTAPAGKFSPTDSTPCRSLPLVALPGFSHRQRSAFPQTTPSTNTHRPFSHTAGKGAPSLQLGGEPARPRKAETLSLFTPGLQPGDIRPGTTGKSQYRLLQTTPSTNTHRPISYTAAKGSPGLQPGGEPRRLRQAETLSLFTPGLQPGDIRPGTTGNSQYRFQEHQTTRNTAQREQAASRGERLYSPLFRPYRSLPLVAQPDSREQQRGGAAPAGNFTPSGSTLYRSLPLVAQPSFSHRRREQQRAFPQTAPTTPTTTPDTLRELQRIVSLLTSLKPILREDRTLELED